VSLKLKSLQINKGIHWIQYKLSSINLWRNVKCDHNNNFDFGGFKGKNVKLIIL